MAPISISYISAESLSERSKCKELVAKSEELERREFADTQTLKQTINQSTHRTIHRTTTKRSNEESAESETSFGSLLQVTSSTYFCQQNTLEACL
mmetsp:Transcript_2542/g.3902  ORF Transcript_2542/g.3902 Transcript_2542/m.3902 type:complete len:95 (-) Transcript_2542:71-355(-)